MKTSVIFILIYVINKSWCQDETVFHCSPKPGCQIAQCHPVAVGWDRPGFNINEHLHDKEFPITCKSKKTTKSGNNKDLLPIISRNILDISNVKSEFKELEENVEVKMKSIRSFAKEISKIREIQNENTEQSAEIVDLKKDLVRLETMNNQLSEELDEQKQTNNEMEKAMERIEQKLSAMKKPQQVQSGNQQRLTTTIQTTLKPTPSSENCELKVGKICYIFVLQKVDYDTAVDICKRRNADVGLIRNEEPYNAIVKYLAINDLPWINIWTGIRFDPMTRDVTPADSFIKWGSGFPHIGINRKHFTNVYIYANFDLRYQAMENGAPTWKVDGVICEILI
uniref:uncharacterized protein LOC120346318 isoform X2 n=1 Tax=Styela clava TaxID=7725 RepID=UPI001939398F|nr:uncharacterized protein LOC120346318 isoform X2 [Styela clava]